MSVIFEGYEPKKDEKSYSLTFTSPKTKNIDVTITTYSDFSGKTKFRANCRIVFNDDSTMSGQCLSEVKQLINDKTFDKIYRWWEMYAVDDKPMSFKDLLEVKLLMSR